MKKQPDGMIIRSIAKNLHLELLKLYRISMAVILGLRKPWVSFASPLGFLRTRDPCILQPFNKINVASNKIHGSRVLRFCNASLMRGLTKSKPQDDSQGKCCKDTNFIQIVNAGSKWILLFLFLNFTWLINPVFPTDEDQVPIAGFQAGQNNALVLHETRDSQHYLNIILQTHDEQEVFQNKIMTVLKATHDLVREIQQKIGEKRHRLLLPPSFTEEFDKVIKLLEPYDLFDESELSKLAAQYNKENLAPLTKLIERLDGFCEKWDLISGQVRSLTLAIDQSLRNQSQWSALFVPEGPYKSHTIKGCDLYQSIAHFYKTLDALRISSDCFESIWQGVLLSSKLPHLLFYRKNDLTDYFNQKNALLWELVKSFMEVLPEYEALPDSFFLPENAYKWIQYFSNLVDSWPTAENLYTEELMEIIRLANIQYLSIKDKDNLTPEDNEKIQAFWKENGKKLWDLLKGAMKKLPGYGQLLDDLYPDTGDFDKRLSYKRLLNVLQILDLWGQPITIPEDLCPILTKVFSSSPEWEQKAGQFKAELKAFTNMRFIINLLPKLKSHYQDFERKYQENFGKTFDLFAPVACCTMPNGKRFTLPQSSVCKVFPAQYLNSTFHIDLPFDGLHVSLPPIQVLHGPVNVGGEYALYLLGKLFGVPCLPFALPLFENILIHKLSRENAFSLGSRFDIRSRESDSNFDKINHQREIRLQEYLKNPKGWKVSSESGLVFMQEQFTGRLLVDFLKDMAAGKPVSFEQLDIDSFHRQALFCLWTGFSIPLENWGLVSPENGKLGVIWVGEGVGRYFLSPSSEQPFIPDIFCLLPFAPQKISKTVIDEFLAQDISLLLGHWVADLGCFEDRLQKNKASSSDEEAWGLKIRASKSSIMKLAFKFNQMKKLLGSTSGMTYPQLSNELDPDNVSFYKSIFGKMAKEDRQKNKAKLFFQNVLLSAISGLDETRFSHEDLKSEAEALKWLVDLEWHQNPSIETILKRSKEKSIKILFQFIYEETKGRPFFEAQKVLDDYEYLKNQASSGQPSPSQNVLVELPDIIRQFITYGADISGKPIDRQIEILSLLFALQPDPSKPHESWQALCESIACSNDPVFIRKFLGISSHLRTFFEKSIRDSGLIKSQSSSLTSRKIRSSPTLFEQAWKECSGFPTLEESLLLREAIALHEFQQYEERLSHVQKEERAPETIAVELFYRLWGVDDPRFRALIDLLMLSRYAAMGKLPEELQEMAGYLASTGFASDPLSSQHVGRSKSSQPGPVAREEGDGQHYVLSWSAWCMKFFHSREAIPVWIREAIISQDMPLLCMKWLHKLEKEGIDITFYAWFKETLLEKATEMQQLLIKHPHLTFPEIMQRLWSSIFAAYQQQFKTNPTAEKLSSHIVTQAKQRHDLITLDTSDIDWDWIPDGKDQNLDDIIEGMDAKYSHCRFKRPHSRTDAAAVVLAYFIPRSYGLTVMQIILSYAAQLGVNGGSLSLQQKTIATILENLVEQKASFEAQKMLIALYLRCPVERVDVQADSLKISGTQATFGELNFIISLFPHITSLDISNNALDCLWFCSCESDVLHGKGFLKLLPKLETLNISNNPVWDPTPLRRKYPIQNIIFSGTFIPGLDLLNHLLRFSSFSPLDSRGVVSIIKIMKEPSKWGRHTEGTINPRDHLSTKQIQRVIYFYKGLLMSMERVHASDSLGGSHDDISNMEQEDQRHYDAYYHSIVVSIIDQMTRNFWHETLADEQFFPNDSIGHLNPSTLFNYLKKAVRNPDAKASKACRKWLFALENHLPLGVPPEDLVWDDNQRTFFLSQLNFANGTAQNYMNCLNQHWVFLIKNQGFTGPKAWYTSVVTLAANQFAQNFWREALSVDQKINPKELLQVLTINNPAASLESKKLALRWLYNLPPETCRESLCFTFPRKQSTSVNPYLLTELVISGADLSRSVLGFLKHLSSLTKLELPNCGLTTAQLLSENENLTALNLSGNQVESLWGFYGDESKIFKFPKLITLNLTHNLIKFSVREWGEFKKVFSSIKEVDMSHNCISIAPVMTPYQIKKEEKATCFKIDHNNIPFSDIHQLYDFKFFWEREQKDFRSIIPQSNHQHPIHIFYDNEKLFCQIYKNSSLKQYKLPWDISTCQYPIVERLNTLYTQETLTKDKRTTITLTEEDKQSLVMIIIENNPGYLNTAHLYITPKKDRM